MRITIDQRRNYTVKELDFNDFAVYEITGYLTSDISTWNNAKLAELHDRVKHI
jgi:anaerobic ribonucleoside-triphosphate reductase